MRTAVLLLLGVGLGANLAGTATGLYHDEALSVQAIALSLVIGGALGGLVALVVWDVTRDGRSRESDPDT